MTTLDTSTTCNPLFKLAHEAGHEWALDTLGAEFVHSAGELVKRLGVRGALEHIVASAPEAAAGMTKPQGQMLVSCLAYLAEKQAESN